MILKTIAQSIQHIFDIIITISKQIGTKIIPHRLPISHLLQLLVSPQRIILDTAPPQNTQLDPAYKILNQTINAYAFKINQYHQVCSQIKKFVFDQRQMQQEYLKLEQLLQKNETEIRKHIGTEQQLKLYIDTLKAQFDEGENQRLELLQNSKSIIKSLKAEKQMLYDRLRMYELHNISLSTDKKSRNASNRKKSDRKERERIKTEYVSSHKKELPRKMPKKKQKIGERRQVPKIGHNNHNNSRYSYKALNVCISNNKKLTDLKKKQQISYLSKKGDQGSNNKDFMKEKSPLKNSYIVKLSSSKKSKKKVQSAQKSRNKSNKKANRSVFSVSSLDLDKEGQNRKEKQWQIRKEKEEKKGEGLQRFGAFF